MPDEIEVKICEAVPEWLPIEYDESPDKKIKWKSDETEFAIVFKWGDTLLKNPFDDEKGKRFESKNLSVIQFILNNNYLDYLTKEELEIILECARVSLGDIAIKQLKELLKSLIINYQEIKKILDTMLFIDLKYNENIVLWIFN